MAWKCGGGGEEWQPYNGMRWGAAISGFSDGECGNIVFVMFHLRAEACRQSESSASTVWRLPVIGLERGGWWGKDVLDGEYGAE